MAKNSDENNRYRRDTGECSIRHSGTCWIIMRGKKEVGVVQKLGEYVYMGYAGRRMVVSFSADEAAKMALAPMVVAGNPAVERKKSVAELRVVA